MDYDSSPAYSHSSAVLFSPPDVGRGGGYGRESDLYSSPYGNEHDDRVEARLLHPDEPDEGLGYFPRQSVAATSSFGSSSEKGLLASSAPPPVETITMTTLRVVLPATILPLITGLAWGWALYTIKPRSFPLIGDWLITHPSTMTYIISLTSSILSILVSWSFGRSAAYFISKRMARDPCSVEEVGAWVYLSTHQIKWSMSRWIFITGIATVFLSIQTAGFNSLLARAFVRTRAPPRVDTHRSQRRPTRSSSGLTADRKLISSLLVSTRSMPMLPVTGTRLPFKLCRSPAHRCCPDTLTAFGLTLGE